MIIKEKTEVENMTASSSEVAAYVPFLRHILGVASTKRDAHFVISAFRLSPFGDLSYDPLRELAK